MARTKNLVIWGGVALVALGLWFFAARTREHLVDPMTFIAYVAVAAACLTGLFWWGLAGPDEDRNGPEGQEEKH
jgi:di/tricarboxylate transporter